VPVHESHGSLPVQGRFIIATGKSLVFSLRNAKRGAYTMAWVLTMFAMLCCVFRVVRGDFLDRQPYDWLHCKCVFVRYI